MRLAVTAARSGRGAAVRDRRREARCAGARGRHCGLAEVKGLSTEASSLNADARNMDWSRKGPQFAAELERKLLARLDAACADPAVSAVAVVTHVPLLEAQMTRKREDSRWGTSNAYFGNLTTGRAVMQREKVRAIISGHGHSHVGQEAVVERGVVTRVVPSDYGAPKFVLVEL